MKYYFSLFLVLLALISKGQDSTKHLSRSSISFTAGTNIVYPNTHQIDRMFYGFNSFWNGGAVWNYAITPVTSISPCIALTYNYLLHQSTHFSFTLNSGITYTEYIYKMNATGTYETSEIKDNGTYMAEAKANVVELHLGISANYRILKKVSWHNKIDFVEGFYNRSFPTFSTNAPSASPFYTITDAINANASTYAYLFYETGFNFQLSDKLSVLPTIAIPLFNVGFLFENNGAVINLPTFPYPEAGAPSPIYRSLRTGITLTYNFAKK